MESKNLDYSALRKKFPAKDPKKKKKVAAIKAIRREYAAKRAALGNGAPVLRKGIVFYAVVVIGLAMLGSLVLSVCGKGGPKAVSRAQMQARKSVASVAEALGRYRYHVGSYPSTEEGLEALAAITPKKKGWNGPYVNHVVKDPWGRDYVYVCNGEGECPTLYSTGPDGLAGTTDDVLPDRSLYDEPFRDTSWTKGWMPYYLRGYVLAGDRRQKAQIEEQVQSVLAAGKPPVEGEFALHDGWEFSRDRKEWRPVRIPHDWTMADPFAPADDGGAGRLPGRGIGWYRRTLELPREAAGRFVAIRFGGVVSNPEVFLNGEKIGRWDCACTPFEADVSAKLRFGERNELLVKVDAANPRGGLCQGAGMCRDVVLAVEDYEDRAIWGSVRITTSDVTPERANVRVTYLTPASKSEIVNEFAVERPVLWDVANPKLHETKICGKTYRYAIRTVEPAPDGKILLNGRSVELKGVDLGPGVASLSMVLGKDALRRLLKVLKEMGANALRVPCAPSDPLVAELCDEVGLLVWNEGPRFRLADDVCDLCAMPKDGYWLCRSLWNDRKDTVYLFPHWNWDGREGEKVTVGCCTSGDEAELFVNGESAGRRKVREDARPAMRGDIRDCGTVPDGCCVSWEVPYHPGEIKVIAFRNGHPFGEDFRRTAFKAAAVRLAPEQTELADGELAFVKVEMEDDDGTALPLADARVGFELEGPGEIVAVGNGSHVASCPPASSAASHPLFRGRALVVVRRTGGSGLPLKLKASSSGVRSDFVELPLK